jgi:cell division protein FtsI/penicillin-binding protein 2
MEPFTGRVLALTGKSTSIKNIELHGGFPAASIFKIITSAAALEQSDLKPNSRVAFRGGNYTLNYTNYQPDKRRDNRVMTVEEALGRSCNPVFARVALNNLNITHLRQYAAAFGFNSSLGADLPISVSGAIIPEGEYQITRTAAGFGKVTLSPLHAAALMSSIANGGILPRPRVVQRVITADGQLLYYGRPQALRRSIDDNTAKALLEMLETTTTIGTSRREFMRNSRPVMGKIRVAAKTGTLSGKNPTGLNNWFVAAAPIENPQLVVAVVVVDARDQSARASALGRRILEQQLLGRY